ncbi:MAG: hypothetical protein Q4A71_04790 [Actinomycetaceae bacterium]|nr:hypothetical protein [Actinomycetaceae bacterium]
MLASVTLPAVRLKIEGTKVVSVGSQVGKFDNRGGDQVALVPLLTIRSRN